MEKNRVIQFTAIAISLICLIYTYLSLQWNAAELIRFIAGILFLWSPLAIVAYTFLRREVDDAGVCFVLSVLSSYTLTTLLYFVLTVIGLSVVFYAVQAIIIAISTLYLFRYVFRDTSSQWSRFGSFIRSFQLANINWVLILIVVAGIAINLRYKVFSSVDQATQSHVLTGYPDHLYSSGLSYELGRHIPPLQATTSGGLPERAYHMFPHLTTTLIARFTGMEDMLRVHLVYHYIVIEMLLPLGLYAIAKVITGSSAAGYLSALFLYLFALSTPPIVPNTTSIFYTTLFPHVSSGLDPVALTSPQMYSSLVVLYGVLLSLAIASKKIVYSATRGFTFNGLLIVAALMVGALTRFRVHLLLPILPAFLTVMILLGIRRRQSIYWIASAVALVVTAGLYLEMQSPAYLPGSTSIQIGYNRLTEVSFTGRPLFNNWIFSDQVFAIIERSIPNTRVQVAVWHFISMSMFTFVNIIGLPLLIATVYFYTTRTYRVSFSVYKNFLLIVLLVSLLVSMFLSMNYDPYSVPGQITFHTRWFLFPLMAVAMYGLLVRLQKRVQWGGSRWFALGLIAVIVVQVVVRWSLPTSAQTFTASLGSTLSKADYDALLYIRATTPPDSVILTRAYLPDYQASSYAVSGIGGRAAYAEYTTVHTRLIGENRVGKINELWAQSDMSQFCATLTETPVTHLVTQKRDPLALTEQPVCLQQLWQSDDLESSVWAVID